MVLLIGMAVAGVVLSAAGVLVRWRVPKGWLVRRNERILREREERRG